MDDWLSEIELCGWFFKCLWFACNIWHYIALFWLIDLLSVVAAVLCACLLMISEDCKIKDAASENVWSYSEDLVKISLRTETNVSW